MRTPHSQALRKSANRKKILVGLALLSLTSAIAIGGSLAFFSDTLTTTNTAKSGTLDITMKNTEFKMYVNGATTPVSDLKNLNPGDVIVIKGTINNKGNKSAWMQELVHLRGDMPDLDQIKVYRGEFTQANIDTATGRITIDSNRGTGHDRRGTGAGYAPVYVMNGTGTVAEVEKNISVAGTVPNGTLIANGAYQSIYTIYFDKAATNKYQDKELSIQIIVRAMQYRNNPNPVWTDVVNSSFGES